MQETTLHQIVRMSYFSTVSPRNTAHDIANILKYSDTRNKHLHITGSLIFCGGFFIQYLEGERYAVSTLYRSISYDPRHCDVTIVDYREIETRCFREWSMKFFNLEDGCPGNPLDRLPAPPNMSGDDFEAVMRAVCDETRQLDNHIPQLTGVPKHPRVHLV